MRTECGCEPKKYSVTRGEFMDLDGSFHLLSCPPEADRATSRRVFAIGKFDGLHIAHQAVLGRAVAVARDTDADPCLFTFTPHPRFALTGDTAYERLLTPLCERARAAHAYGMRDVFVATFDEIFRNQTADEFVVNYLLPLKASHLVVGYDFRLGRRGAYGPDDLARIGQTLGIAVDTIAHVDFADAPVSSSAIRSHLAAGEVASVTAMLGRPYRLRGTVVVGDRRGRTIGFPTANLVLAESFVLPRVGVYAVQCEVGGASARGMMNVGRRPTVYEQGDLTIEVHLLDYAQDLYGCEMAVDLLGYVREERKFADVDELRTQLFRDREAAVLWPAAPERDYKK